MVLEKLKTIILIAICILFLIGGIFYNQANYDNSSIDFLASELEPVKLNSLWTNSKIGEVARYKINNDLLLILSENNMLYEVNLGNGQMDLKFKNPTNITNHPIDIICSDSYIMIQYESFYLILNVNDYQILKRINRSELGDGNMGDAGLVENIIFYWSYPRESIVARDIFTLEELWTYGGNRKKHGVIKIRKIENEYYFRRFEKLNMNNGMLVEDYSVEATTGIREKILYKENQNRNFALERYLDTNSPYDIHKITDEKYYKIYSRILTLLTQNGDVIYEKNIDEEVLDYGLIGDKIFISLANDEMIVIDTNKGVIIDDFPFKAAGRSPIIEYEDSLILCSEDGSGYIYERIKLE